MVLDAEMRNVSNSDCLSSINNTKKYDSNNNNDTVIISPIKYEPPEADKLQDVLSITFLNMNNQLPENLDELLLKNTDTSLENRLITDFSSMKPLCNASTDGDDDDNCNTSRIEISTTTIHQHDKVGVGDDDDANNRGVGFEDDPPDSVDKFLSGQILLNTSGPAHNNHSSNDEIDTTNYIDENDINVSSITTTPVTPPLIRLPPPPQLFFTKPTITEEDSLKPTSIIPDNTPTIPKEANLQETSLNIISSALTTDKYVVDDKDTGIEMDTVVNPTAEEEEDIHDGDINNDNDDNCHNYQSFEDLKFVLKEDSEQNSAMPNSNDDNVCGNHYDHSIYNNTNYNNSSTPTNSNEMNMILNHLEMLSLSSREQSRQFECILDQLNETKLKLERLEQAQSDIIELVNNITYRTSVVQSPPGSNLVTSKECNIVNSEQSEIKSIELANQIILQLRTVQGDFSRRYAQISDNMKKILSNVQESSCHPSNKANALHNLESRISLLPKLTTDSIKLILHEELLRIFSSNVPRIVEPLQHSLCSVINSHLSTLPTTVNDNVQRVLREKNFTSQIVRSASGILSTELSGAYRDSLNKIFIPALEKSVKKLFSDLNNVFQTGTQQYLNQIPSRIQIPFDSANFTTSLMHDISSLIKSTILETLKEVEIPGKTIETSISNSGSERINPAKVNRTLDLYPTTSRRNDNSSEVVCDKMSNTTSNLTKLDKTATAHKSYNRHLNKTGSGGSVISTTPLVSNSGSSTSSHSVSNSSHQKNKTQTTNEVPRDSVASTSFPPPPTTTVTSSSVKPDELTRLFGQAQVLIRSNRLVDALELALVSTNQPLLLDVCGDIDVNQLFSSGDYKIGQNILLSLIHQLSCGDLTIQLDLKIKYLQEAILCLEFDDPTTSVHGPAILHLLNVRLDALLNSNKITNSLRCCVVKLNRSVKCLLNQNSKDK
ncbi:Enhancer of mRNA-decapping protein 4 [Schistosoma japonicum]|nr:Enhancer of mRNA-decapping protein 4 [Schistosoma japonicum]